MKRFLLYTFLILLIAVAGLLLFISTLSGERIASWLAATLSDQLKREVTISGPVVIDWSSTPTIQLTQLRVANASWGEDPWLIAISEAELQLKLAAMIKGELDIIKLDVQGMQLNLQKNTAGLGNWVFEGREDDSDSDDQAKEDDAPCGSLPKIAHFSLTQAVVKLGETTWPNSILVEGMGWNRASNSAKLAFSFDGSLHETPLTASGEIGFSDDQARRIESLALRANNDSLSGELEGKLHSIGEGCVLDAKIDLKGQSLKDINSFYPAALPDIGPFSLSTTFSNPAGRLEFSDLTFQMKESDLSGAFQIEQQTRRVALNGTLQSKRFRLQDFAKERVAIDEMIEPEDDESTQASRLIPEVAIPVDALQQAAVQLQFSAEELELAPEAMLRDVDLGLQSDERHAEVDLRKAVFHEGTLKTKAVLSYPSNAPQLKLNSELLQVKLGELLQKPEELSVRADIKIDVDSFGATLPELANQVTGSLDLLALNGTFKNSFISVLTAGLRDILSPLLGSRERNVVHCLIAHFDLKDGVANDAAFIAHTSDLGIIGKGSVSLAKEEVDFSFKMESGNSALSHLLVPFTASGPIQALHFVPSLIETGKEIATAPLTIVKDAAEDIKSAVASLVTEPKEGELSPLCKRYIDLVRDPEGLSDDELQTELSDATASATPQDAS